MIKLKFSNVSKYVSGFSDVIRDKRKMSHLYTSSFEQEAVLQLHRLYLLLFDVIRNFQTYQALFGRV